MTKTLMVVLLAASVAAQAVDAQGTNLRVAVYPFDVQGTPAARGWAGKVDFGQVAAQSAQNTLANMSNMSVMTRDQLQRIAVEQGVRMDERFDINTTPKLGKLLGVQAIVSGTVESITATESKQTTASSGNGSSSVKRTAKVVVALRMYSTESGEIIFIGKATADTTDGVARQVVVGPNVINCLRRPKDCLQGGGSGQWQSQPISPDAADALVSGVIASAIDSIGKKVAADFEKVLSRAPKVAAPKVQVASNPPQIVGEVEGELVINRGTEAQIVEGDSLQIERKDATIGDGENQIQTTTVIGTFVVTSVGDGWSKGTFRPRKSPRPKLPQKGDMIKMTRK